MCSSSKLERDRAEMLVEKAVEEGDSVLLQSLADESAALEKVAVTELSWEEKLGYLKTGKCLVKWRPAADSVQTLLRLSLTWLAEDEEVRVKEAAGECVGALCSQHGLELYNKCVAPVLELTRSHLQRKIEPDKEEVAGGKLMDRKEWKNLAAWKDLDICLSCLQRMLEGVGRQAEGDREILDLILSCVRHRNRFVRDSGYKTLASWLRSGSDKTTSEERCELVLLLSGGLTDSWAQVRLSSTAACREFLLSLSPGEREEQMPALLPRLCLNRYFPAEGVRRQAQTAWRALCGEEGRALLGRFISHTVEHYTSSAGSDSPGVREAAGLSISELVNKLDPDTVSAHVPALLDCLSVEDPVWQVRDSASVAASLVIRHHPLHPHLHGERVDTLLATFSRHLQDQESSVRQGAALALANTVRGLGEKVTSLVSQTVRRGLEAVKDQDQLETGPEPWQIAEACVHTVAELSKIKERQQMVSSLLPHVFQSCQYKHSAHLQYCAAVCRRLPEIATNLDKRYFKPHLELEVIFVCLEADNPQASAAGRDCLQTLSRILGPNILRGRVENLDPALLPLHDRAMSGCPAQATLSRPVAASQPIGIPRVNSCDSPSLGGTPPT